jgi:GT2 family glycosyltransferase/glycosyltransferase involved in cell wall biosynthesis
MRIAFVHARMLVGWGVDLTIDALASELGARGHDITVYTPEADSEFAHRPYTIELIPTVPRHSFPAYERNARAWAGFIDANGHDIVCITAFPFFGLIPKLRTPAVAVDYGDVPAAGLPAKRRANLAYMKLRQQRVSFPKAKAIVTISDFVRSALPSSLRSRARTIYLGVDHYPAAEDGEGGEMRRRLGIADEAFVALYVGRLNAEGQPYKGTADLLSMAPRWREAGVVLVMAGLGTEADAEAIRAAGAIPALRVSPSDMPGLYSSADLYVTASRWEGFDLPVMEAAYQGVPAVALRVGAHPEVVADGSTGVLVDDVPALEATVTSLYRDPAHVAAMGAAAAERARTFSWAHAASAYDELFAGLDIAPAASRAHTRDVTAVILNYEAPRSVLEPCVRSVLEQSYPTRVLVVDNASSRNREVVDAMEREHEGVEVLRLEENHGFAGGMNRGVASSTTEFVLLLNNDTVLEPNAVEEMVRVISTGDHVVGAAPKLMNQGEPHFFDAMGVAIDEFARAHNVGIGQIDVGQFDRIEPRIGVCFAATLLRRHAFDEGMVGPLDERYFMYYEDVDWCLRASLLGHTFLTAPKSVVYHAHSYSAKKLPVTRKQTLLMKNLVRTITRDYPSGRWIKVLAWWTARFVRSAVFGPMRRMNVAVLASIVPTVLRYRSARRTIQGRRRRSLDDLIKLGSGEEPFFDPSVYRPIRSLAALAAMYRRLYLITGESRHLTVAETAAMIDASGLEWDRDVVCSRLEPLLSSEPPAVKDYIQNLDAYAAVT